jgi:hypothetical protein
MKQIPEFPNYYITKDGRVWSEPNHIHKGKWLKPGKSRGYLGIILSKNKQCYSCKVHHLVLETYVGPCPEGMECRHLNGMRVDNRLENLCWGTRSENRQDATKHGTATGGAKCSLKGSDNPMAKLNEEQVCLMRNAYYDGAYTQYELADYFGMSQSSVQRIVTKNNWGHLNVR